MADPYFTKATLDFLRNLARNNNRDWFEANKPLYETRVRTPALSFISDMAEKLPGIAPRFVALPAKSGGSLMRVHRDTRFSKNKEPYKTNIGIQFRHQTGKDVHAPGYYLHIAPEECFLGVGIWHPDAPALQMIRESIDSKAKTWLQARDDKKFKQAYTLSGDSLKRPPRGYSAEHPLLVDLVRKDFIAVTNLPYNIVTSSKLLAHVVQQYRVATPFMRYLCNALELRFD